MAWHVSRVGSRAISQGLGSQAPAGPEGQTAPAHRCHRARGGPRSREPIRARLHAGAECEPAHLERLPGRTGPWRALADLPAQGVQEPRGGRRPKQTALLGLNAMTRRASRWHGACVSLALMCRLAARAGAWPRESLGAGRLEVGHDPARVDALCRPLHRAHHAARRRPRPGLRTGRVEARDLAAITPIGTVGLCDDLVSQLVQDTSAGHPGHRMEVGWRLEPRPHLGGGQRAVTAHEQQGARPRLTPTLAQPLQHAEPLRRPEAPGLEKRGNQAV